MQISTSKTGGYQERDLGDTLPIEYREGARIGGGFVLLAFGGVFAGFPLLMIVLGQAGDETIPAPAYLLLGVFLLVGLGIMAGGVSSLLHKLELDITSAGVRGLRRSLKGTRTWTDPFPDYRGVLAEEEYHSGGKNRSSYTLYKVILKHQHEDDRDVLLYCSRSSDRHRGKTEMYARLLQRPVLLEEGDGRYVERAVEDLDKSIKELVQAGKMDVDFNPYEQPQGGKLTLTTEPAGYRFEYRYRGFGSSLTGFVFLCAGAGLVYWYFGPGVPDSAEGSPWVVPIVGTVFALIGVITTAFALFGSTSLTVHRDGLHTWTRLLNWTFGDKRLPASSVEEIRVGKNKRGRLGLTAQSDHDSLSFGTQTLSVEELEFVRRCIIATISRGR